MPSVENILCIKLPAPDLQWLMALQIPKMEGEIGSNLGVFPKSYEISGNLSIGISACWSRSINGINFIHTWNCILLCY